MREGGGQKTVVGYRSTDNKMFVDRSASGRTDFTTNFTTLHEAVVQPVNGVIHMHIFVDESSLEVFGNDGTVVFSDIILPDSSSSGMSFYASGGTVVVKTLHVYSLKIHGEVRCSWQYRTMNSAGSPIAGTRSRRSSMHMKIP